MPVSLSFRKNGGANSLGQRRLIWLIEYDEKHFKIGLLSLQPVFENTKVYVFQIKKVILYLI